MSVWESVEALHSYVYRSAHAYVLRHRKKWFEPMATSSLVLWWIPAGHIPSIEEAKQNLELLQHSGPNPWAFTFKRCFVPPVFADRSPGKPAIKPF